MIYCKMAGGSCHSDACTLKGDCVTPEDHFHYFRAAAAKTEACLNEENRRLRAENAGLVEALREFVERKA